MPGKNALKIYIENGHYHIYNRGVEKREIFKDDQDYSVFLSYLKDYLSPKDPVTLSRKLTNLHLLPEERAAISSKLRMNNFYREITLLSFCLMPNHFHLLLKQANADGIDKFLRSIGTRYSMYFNRKYDRIGPLYQGRYKAVIIESNPLLLYVSRYIHKQALDLKSPQPSSYPEFIGERNITWVQPGEILDYFSRTYSITYQKYVMEKDDTILSDYIID
jgi:putative transposase